MTPSQKRQTAFRIEPEILDGLHEVKTRDGLPISEQVRRALREWLQHRGVKLKSGAPAGGHPQTLLGLKERPRCGGTKMCCAERRQ